jgi:hypothetical protein
VTVRQVGDDGTASTLTHRSDGTLLSSVLTWSDGSQLSTTFGANGTTPVSESVVKPDLHTVLLGSWDDPAAAQASSDLSLPDTTQPTVPPADATQPTAPAQAPVAQHPKFKIYMQGVKTLSWDYLDAYGVTQQHGTFEPDGSVSIDETGSYGSAFAFRQHWQLRMEDWNRRYYTLNRVDEYFEGGQSIFRQLVLGANQSTVRESRLFHQDGTTYQVRYYDQNGNSVFTDDFDDKGTFVLRTPASTQWTSSELAGYYLTELPKDSDFKPLYNLRGTAYADPPTLQSGSSLVDPLFVTTSK